MSFNDIKAVSNEDICFDGIITHEELVSALKMQKWRKKQAMMIFRLMF